MKNVDDAIKKAAKELSDRLLKEDWLVGVGVGVREKVTGLVIIVMVLTGAPEPSLPETYEGFPVIWEYRDIPIAF